MSSHVLDASALLALFKRESGEIRVRSAIHAGAVVGTVNLSEVVAKLVDGGLSEQAIHLWADGLAVAVVDFDRNLAYAAGALRTPTRHLGLSLGDRACLALAQRLGLPALTADQAWATLQIGVAVEAIR